MLFEIKNEISNNIDNFELKALIDQINQNLNLNLNLDDIASLENKEDFSLNFEEEIEDFDSDNQILEASNDCNSNSVESESTSTASGKIFYFFDKIES